MNSFGQAIENIFMVIVLLFLGITWLAGFVISGSAWAIIPFYAWYVVIEQTMVHYHILGYVVVVPS